MLHLRLRVPTDLTDNVSDLLGDNDTVVNIAVLPDAYVKPPGCLILADVARENAQDVIRQLRDLGVDRRGAIAISEADTILSDAADAAERSAPGSPIDGVVWDLIEDRTRDDVRLSWAFMAFLTLATMIAGVGRLLDQPILIVGAMVVGPEFAPVAAICFALARPRLSLLPRAVGTLLGGFLVATMVSSTVWAVVHAFGGFTNQQLADRPATDFIVHPDIWSFAIALLAGVAGTLSLTTSKSATLVGVFISVTTVPAVGTLSLAIATTTWADARGSLLQLCVNITGLIFAGTATLLLQRIVWRRVGRRHSSPSRTVA
ncbi:MAG: DUF389 domain-containing protein [Propionibacteriales bacterium]|nr:DUF389 domain-containing protein [Propionibacteriales bacterium]